jgi:uncharacterized protein YdiU (UPF0061 family)
MLLQRVETDMTIFYRGLADVPAGESDSDALLSPVIEAYYMPEDFGAKAKPDTIAWLRRYSARLAERGIADKARRKQMNAINPRYVLRNYLAQEAIDKAEQGDLSLVVETLDVMRRPYKDQPGREHFAAKRPEWARNRAGCSMLSCSS